MDEHVAIGIFSFSHCHTFSKRRRQKAEHLQKKLFKYFLHTDIGSPFLKMILVFFELCILSVIIYCIALRSFDVKITIEGLR